VTSVFELLKCAHGPQCRDQKSRSRFCQAALDKVGKLVDQGADPRCNPAALSATMVAVPDGSVEK